MKYFIENGDKFLCIKGYVMDTEIVEFSEGEVYRSQKTGCITDNSGDTNHFMENEIDFFEHFKPLLCKQKP